jgi:hypothetical protein
MCIATAPLKYHIIHHFSHFLPYLELPDSLLCGDLESCVEGLLCISLDDLFKLVCFSLLSHILPMVTTAGMASTAVLAYFSTT